MNIIERNGSQLPVFPRLFFDDIFGRELFNWENNDFTSTITTLPWANIKETADSYEVEVAAPGMDKSDINITVDGNLLTISAIKEHKETTEQENLSVGNSAINSSNEAELTKNVVDEEKIRARYENGLLLLTVPKRKRPNKNSRG